MKFIDDAIKESEKRMEKKKPEKKVSSDIDDGLVDIIEGNKTKIFVVGAGGAGNNTISRLNEMGIEGATTITVLLLILMLKIYFTANPLKRFY